MRLASDRKVCLFDGLRDDSEGKMASGVLVWTSPSEAGSKISFLPHFLGGLDCSLSG